MGFEIYQDDDGGWRWRFRGPDDKVVAVSGEPEYSEGEAKRTLVEFKRQVEVAQLPDWESDDWEQ